jgi:hypothetical protein
MNALPPKPASAFTTAFTTDAAKRLRLALSGGSDRG